MWQAQRRDGAAAVRAAVRTDGPTALILSRQNLDQTGTTVQGGAAVAGGLAVSSVLSASRLEATGSLLNSYPEAGVYCGLVPTVGFASCVLH